MVYRGPYTTADLPRILAGEYDAAFADWAHAAAAEVETDDREAALGQQRPDHREEAPLHEALETVTDHNRWAFSGSRAGVDQPLQDVGVLQLEAGPGQAVPVVDPRPADQTDHAADGQGHSGDQNQADATDVVVAQ